MFVIAFFALLALTSPAHAEGEQTPPTQEGAVRLPDESAYRLGPGDALEIKFLLNPELNEHVQIRPDGYISMAQIGELNVAGLTVSEIVARLTKAYETVLRSPSVVVQIREFANRRVFVGGEVAKPGVLPLIGRQTALGAVMEAGGMKGSADHGAIIVLRRGDEDRPRVIRLSMKSEHGEAPDASAFPLQPLDVVLVNESGVSRVNRTIDQYVRQMIPFLVTAGFTYLTNGALFGVR